VPESGGFALDLLCIDPSSRLEDILRRQGARVFFSGTLSPPEYFTRLLAPNLDPEFLALPSPFPPENCAYLARTGVSTRWKDREREAEGYARLVAEIFDAVEGNLIVFSPSFAFQNALLARLLPHGGMPGNWVAQSPGMTEAERTAFLSAFDGDETRGFAGTRGFAVLGGSFSESVDLAGEKLVGAIVFGLGLPQVNQTNDVIREYFESQFGKGYAWAYAYPGMNRVLQAAGRVIRSESDLGFVLLADDRYLSPDYRGLIPEYWDMKKIGGIEEFIAALPCGLARGPAS
jgi:Rad3-related DNA helicase